MFYRFKTNLIPLTFDCSSSIEKILNTVNLGELYRICLVIGTFVDEHFPAVVYGVRSALLSSTRITTMTFPRRFGFSIIWAQLDPYRWIDRLRCLLVHLFLEPGPG